MPRRNSPRRNQGLRRTGHDRVDGAKLMARLRRTTSNRKTGA